MEDAGSLLSEPRFIRSMDEQDFWLLTDDGLLRLSRL